MRPTFSHRATPNATVICVGTWTLRHVGVHAPIDHYADWRECHLIKIDHWVPSTKNYCACDYNLEDISVSQRHWTKSVDPRTPRSHDNPAGNLSE